MEILWGLANMIGKSTIQNPTHKLWPLQQLKCKVILLKITETTLASCYINTTNDNELAFDICFFKR